MVLLVFRFVGIALHSVGGGFVRDDGEHYILDLNGDAIAYWSDVQDEDN